MKRNGQQAIDRISGDLGLEERTRQLAGILVGTCDIVDACNGRPREALIAGCVYLAIREHQEPVSLPELAEVVDLDAGDIVRTYQAIVDTLSIKLQPETPVKYVDRYVEELNRKYDSKLGTEVADTARALIHETWGQGFSSGSSPIGIAAGAVYLAADIENKRVTQKEVADVANITPGTVRTNAQTHRARYQEVDWI